MLETFSQNPSPSIRNPTIGFANDYPEYSSDIRENCALPKGLSHLQHSITWPVDMSDPLAHITTYFERENYSQPEPGDKHPGIDIQLPLGSKILSPDNATVVYVDSDSRTNKARELTNIMLYSEDNHIIYWLCHLNTKTIPEHILKRSYFDKWSDTKLKQGEFIGEVGVFFNQMMAEKHKTGLDSNIKIPEDVEKVYGRSYNHLHLETHYIPDIYKLYIESFQPVDPLKLLKKLY